MCEGVEVSKELDLTIRRDKRLTSARPVRLHQVVHHPGGSVIPERPLRELEGERVGSLPGCGERLGHFAARAFAHACNATTPADSASDSSTYDGEIPKPTLYPGHTTTRLRTGGTDWTDS